MAVKDRLGTEVKEGDFVVVHIDEAVVCRVVSIREPSLISAGKDNMVMIGDVCLVSEHHIPFNPQLGNMVFVKVVTPANARPMRSADA